MLPIESEVTIASSWTGDPPEWLKGNVSPPPDGPINIPSCWPVPYEPKPHKCPVCAGSGSLKMIVGGPPRPEDRNCHGCDGKGWVTV